MTAWRVGMAVGIAAIWLVPAAYADGEAAPGEAPRPEVRAQAEAAIGRGLGFLLGRQNHNGSFGIIPGAPAPGEVGITALVVRAVAKAPERLRPETAAAALERAIAYLRSNQQPDGSFSPPGTGLGTYRTALTVTALAAADPSAYADEIARARGYLERTQFSERNGLEAEGAKSPYYGGWGYGKQGTEPDADLSNVHFALEALKEAGLAPGSEVWKRAAIFLQRCQNRSESNDVATETVVILDDGGFMYDPALDRSKSEASKRPDGRVEIPSYASMTYAGLLSMLHANLGRDDPRVRAAFSWIQRHYTLTENFGLGTRQDPQRARMGLFYYYQAFARALDAWGEETITDAAGAKRPWAADLSRHLASAQRPDGSWVNEEPRWWEGDPVLCTGYAVLALDIAYPWLAERSADE